MFVKQDVVYTGKFSLEGIETIWVREGFRDIVFLHGDGEELIVKEYGNSDTELARAEQRGTALCFEGSGKPLAYVDIAGIFTTVGKHKIELTIPSGFKGQIYGESKSGDIFLGGTWELQNLQMKTASGDIGIGRVQAEHILIESASGDIDVEEAWGDRQLFSASGDICLKAGRGSLHVKTKSGDMEVSGLDAKTVLECLSGDIAADFEKVTQPVKITTVSGDADIRIAADSSVNIEGRTVSGDVSVRLPLAQIRSKSEKHVLAHMGSGAIEDTPIMDISSVSGDVCVSN